ncbi:hypothetical protein BJ322DRAFT_1083595, partial [Thelephora terrestris]
GCIRNVCNELDAEDRSRQNLALLSGSGSKLLFITHSSDSSLPVDRLLNPCRCKSVWECRCNRSAGTSDQGSLETLARVAASISINPPPDSPEPPSVRKSCCASKHPPNTTKDTGRIRGPDLPRLLLDPEHTFSSRRDAPPLTTPTSIPSIKSVVLLAGTGCSCGFECACPGCVEHRVPSSSTETQESPNLRSCSDDCPHCVDRLGGVALPEPDSLSQRPSIIESFLNRMPSLPQKNRSAHIDPTNVTVFPAGLFSVDLGGPGNGEQQEKARSAWGLVDIPRLEYCGGACGCPDGRCGCGNSCAGCCVEGDDPSDPPGGSNVLAEPMSRANT